MIEYGGIDLIPYMIQLLMAIDRPALRRRRLAGC
jgi:hypothetical protein